MSRRPNQLLRIPIPRQNKALKVLSMADYRIMVRALDRYVIPMRVLRFRNIEQGQDGRNSNE